MLFLACINMAECNSSKWLKYYFLDRGIALLNCGVCMKIVDILGNYVLHLRGLFCANEQLFSVGLIKYKLILTVQFLMIITKNGVLAFICPLSK